MIGKKLKRTIIAVLAIAIVVVFGVTYGSRHFVVNEKTLYFENLPAAFDGYKIVQFSDFHAESFHRFGHEDLVGKMVELINAQNADAVCFTGDIVTRLSSELDGFESVLSGIKARDGVFSVMGNHDYAMYNKGMSEMEKQADVVALHKKEKAFGWKMLLNANQIVKRGGQSIAIVGVENVGSFPHYPSRGSLPLALDGLDKNVFKVLLSHDPTHWKKEVLPRTDIQLTLSGHTHAGQIKLFGWSHAQWLYKEWSGIYEENGRFLNVSEGVGSVILPFRLGAWPEINVITLKRK